MTDITVGRRVRHIDVPFQTGTVDLIEDQTIWVVIDNAGRACFPADKLELQ